MGGTQNRVAGVVLAAVLVAGGLHAAQVGTDEAGAYASWTSGSGACLAYGPWSITNSDPLRGQYKLGVAPAFLKSANGSCFETSGVPGELEASPYVIRAVRLFNGGRLLPGQRFRFRYAYRWSAPLDVDVQYFRLATATGEVLRIAFESERVVVSTPGWTRSGYCTKRADDLAQLSVMVAVEEGKVRVTLADAATAAAGDTGERDLVALPDRFEFYHAVANGNPYYRAQFNLLATEGTPRGPKRGLVLSVQ